MKPKLILITLFSTITLSHSLVAEEDKVGKTIEITEKSYSDIYKAVWLNPNKGTIHKLIHRSEKPPVEGAVIWIEPNDPEFSVGPNIKGVAIYYVGDGEELFKSAKDPAAFESLKRVKKSVLSNGKKPVFIIKTPTAKSVVIVEHSAKDSFKFRWRKVASK